jgi:hypothetical protein
VVRRHVHACSRPGFGAAGSSADSTDSTDSTGIARNRCSSRSLARPHVRSLRIAGGTTRPRFLTLREVVFFARLEAVIEGGSAGPELLTRFGRPAVERLIAQEMLSALQIEQGSEPPELPKLARELREVLELRVGGAEALSALRRAEGIAETELASFLQKRARATYYADQTLATILRPTEDELFLAFRGSSHPYRGARFEEVRARFLRYYAFERMRVIELDYVQSARNRVMVTYL